MFMIRRSISAIAARGLPRPAAGGLRCLAGFAYPNCRAAP